MNIFQRNRRLRALYAARKLEADYLDGMSVSEILIRLGAKSVSRITGMNDEFISGLVPMPASAAYQKIERLLANARVPYNADTRPIKKTVPLMGSNGQVIVLTNTFICADWDATIELVVTDFDNSISSVTLISKQY